MFGSDDDARLREAGIREAAQHEIEKRAPEGNHRLHARVRNGRLSWIEANICASSHARAGATRQNDCFVDQVAARHAGD